MRYAFSGRSAMGEFPIRRSNSKQLGPELLLGQVEDQPSSRFGQIQADLAQSDESVRLQAVCRNPFTWIYLNFVSEFPFLLIPCLAEAIARQRTSMPGGSFSSWSSVSFSSRSAFSLSVSNDESCASKVRRFVNTRKMSKPICRNERRNRLQ